MALGSRDRKGNARCHPGPNGVETIPHDVSQIVSRCLSLSCLREALVWKSRCSWSFASTVGRIDSNPNLTLSTLPYLTPSDSLSVSFVYGVVYLLFEAIVSLSRNHLTPGPVY